ncbi:cAMP-dependent protein kinase type II regulatory subunit-like [Elysia marginata]|uniref:cAMP-dependent protein kinase type II regulatory subunit-like n=1 Tax=Elysia marginata TaxID=1093978 RepID=A0AAV4GBC1_9GAST|nr:cAMP-dependent protein kinase type II regulatory subunit-like [Elysia marginata]
MSAQLAALCSPRSQALRLQQPMFFGTRVVPDRGKYDIYVNVDSKNRKLVGNYNNEGFFGELALMYNMPRAATIVAATDGIVWGLDRQTFRRIVLKTAFNKRKKYEKLIEGCDMLKSLDMYERMNVCDALTSQAFKDGERIIAQGDKADCMYFVEEGQVRVAMINKRVMCTLRSREMIFSDFICMSSMCTNHVITERVALNPRGGTARAPFLHTSFSRSTIVFPLPSIGLQ